MVFSIDDVPWPPLTAKNGRRYLLANLIYKESDQQASLIRFGDTYSYSNILNSGGLNDNGDVPLSISTPAVGLHGEVS